MITYDPKLIYTGLKTRYTFHIILNMQSIQDFKRKNSWKVHCDRQVLRYCILMLYLLASSCKNFTFNSKFQQPFSLIYRFFLCPLYHITKLEQLECRSKNCEIILFVNGLCKGTVTNRGVRYWHY